MQFMNVLCDEVRKYLFEAKTIQIIFFLNKVKYMRRDGMLSVLAGNYVSLCARGLCANKM